MSNKEFEQFLNTSDEWIRTRTGIETRRIADQKKGESTLSIAEIASRNAIKAAGISAEDIDAIIIGTVTPDSLMPTTANQLQAKLGASRAFCFDLQAACSGFVYSLSIADSFIRQGQIKTALVIGADTLSTIVNWKDRTTSVLFGDAAGAMIVQATEDPTHRVISTRLYSDGRHGDILNIPHGFSKVPAYSAEYRSCMHKVQMHGSEVFKLAVHNMVDSSIDLLEREKLTAKDVDFFIFHQANIRIIEMCMKTLGVPPEKTWLNVHKYGNTSAATLPVALDEAIRAEAVLPGKLVCMSTFGGGVTWGSALIRL